MRPQIVKKTALVLCAFASGSSFGQSVSGSSGPPSPNLGPTPPELPLDSNITVLLVAGLVLGVYVAYSKLKVKKIRA